MFFSTHYLQILQYLKFVHSVCAIQTHAVFLNHFPFYPNQKVVWNPFPDDLLPLCKTNLPATISPNIARTSKLPIFQQLLGSKPCPVSTYPAYFRPTSSNAVCCIFSRARFATSKKLLQGVIGRRCAIRKTIRYGWSWIVIYTFKTASVRRSL